MDQKAALICLAQTLAAYDDVSHFAISMRILRKGDFFANLIKNPAADCQTRTAAKCLTWFDANWPADLQWPADIARPSIPHTERSKGRAA